MTNRILTDPVFRFCERIKKKVCFGHVFNSVCFDILSFSNVLWRVNSVTDAKSNWQHIFLLNRKLLAYASKDSQVLIIFVTSSNS